MKNTPNYTVIYIHRYLWAWSTVLFLYGENWSSSYQWNHKLTEKEICKVIGTVDKYKTVLNRRKDK